MPTEIQVQTNDKIIELAGHFLKVQNDGQDLFVLDPIGGAINLIIRKGNNVAKLEMGVSEINAIFELGADYNDGENEARINGEGNAETSTLINKVKRHRILLVQEFADNEAALDAGLEPGTTYRTGDFQKIVH